MTELDQLVVAQVARRLINAGGVEELRHLHGMCDTELELLARRERSAEPSEEAA